LHLLLSYFGYTKEEIEKIISETLTHLEKKKIILKERFSLEFDNIL
jgi:hypothetical protein